MTPPARRPGLGPAERYALLWGAGTPDLDTFLLGAGILSPEELAAVLRVDQRERWRIGQRIPAEQYLRRLPGHPPNPDLVIDLIYNEFLVRERLGERPDPDELYQRFPAQAAVLRDQLALHRAVGTSSPSLETDSGVEEPPPRGKPAAEELPRPFGYYQLLAVLGRGGMGTVYLAEDKRLGRRVALKVPRFDGDRVTEAAERFRREVRSAALARHPNLCPVYEVGQIDGTNYMTMPYVVGEPLSARLSREGTLSVTEALRVAVRVAEAVEAAHQVGVVHRDLKPANVLLDERGDPVVTDFGLARRVGGNDPRMTDLGSVLGTAAYIPPEQIGCDPDAMGPRCDVYSLGVILYEMITGRVPFRGAPGEVLNQVLSVPPEPPSRLRPGLDPRLEAACLKALAKDPEQRFASMAEFAEALRVVADGPNPRSRKGLWIGLTIAFLVLAGSLAIWLATR